MLAARLLLLAVAGPCVAELGAEALGAEALGAGALGAEGARGLLAFAGHQLLRPSAPQFPCSSSVRGSSAARRLWMSSGPEDDEDRSILPAFLRVPRRNIPNRSIRTPAEQREAMGVPMEVGYQTPKDSKSLDQQMRLQANIDTEDFIAPLLDKEIDEYLPQNWIEERSVDGRPIYKNVQSGIVSYNRPKKEASETGTEQSKSRPIGNQGFEDEPLLDLFSDDLGVELSGPRKEMSELSISMFERVEEESSEGPQALSQDEDLEEIQSFIFQGSQNLGTQGSPILEESNWELEQLMPQQELQEYEVLDMPDDAEAGSQAAVPPLIQQMASGLVIKDETSVPKNLSPGHNTGQLNWAEAQLAKAQQMHRPASDLPGFTVPQEPEGSKITDTEEEQAESEAIPLWNPIPFINPEKPRVGFRKDLRTASKTESPTISAENTASPSASAKTEPEDAFLDKVWGTLYQQSQELEESSQLGNSDQIVSASLVETSVSGQPVLRGYEVDKEDYTFTFVDEHNCIGCTNCAMIARNTFKMEEDFGRARVYKQDGDAVEVVEEAVLSCPVDCIHPVSFEELKTAEEERRTDMVNNKSRLVGGSYTADEKGGTPWLRLLSRRVQRGKASTNIFGF